MLAAAVLVFRGLSGKMSLCISTVVFVIDSDLWFLVKYNNCRFKVVAACLDERGQWQRDRSGLIVLYLGFRSSSKTRDTGNVCTLFETRDYYLTFSIAVPINGA